jgi:5-methylcytosine-specific restriction endonuclease McrA
MDRENYIATVAESTVVGLRQPKLEVSRIRNSSDSSDADNDFADRLEAAIEKRFTQLEKQHFKECKEDVVWPLCQDCGRRKPADNSPFGFGRRSNSGNIKKSCKPCINKKTRIYASENPEAGRDRAKKHQEHRKYEVEGRKLAKHEEHILLKLQGGTCAYCGSHLNNEYDVDHFIPVAKGGPHGLSNNVLSCRTCNLDKNANLPEEFLQHRKKCGKPIRIGGFFRPVPVDALLTDVGLTAELVKLLAENDIHTVADTLYCEENQLLRIPNLGRKYLNQIKSMWADLGRTRG